MSASPKRPYERLQRVTGALSRSMGIISKNTSAKNEPSRGGPWYLGFDLSSQSLKAEVEDMPNPSHIWQGWRGREGAAGMHVLKEMYYIVYDVDHERMT
eukprot:1386726-Amorphochlora_amoeboformis.AAC.1